MGSNFEDEKKRIKERYGRVHNEPENETEEISTVSKKFLEFETENALDERSRNFRLQNYDGESQEEDKWAAFKAALKRFLIIAIIITVICATVFFLSKVLAKPRLQTFSLEGNETHFAPFRGIGNIPALDLGALYLKNVEVNASDLVGAVQGCHRLKSIRLDNVRVLREFNGTARLPSLTDFQYSETLGQRSAQEVMSSMTEARLKSILFFRDSATPRHGIGRRSLGLHEGVDLSKVWLLDVNINITSEGRTILVVNHTRGELVLPWLIYLKREEIIQSAGKDLRKLSCNRHKLSLEALPPKITHLTFRDVKLVDGDFSALLKKLSKLVDIRVSFSDLTFVDLGELPRKSLRSLSLSKIALGNSRPGRKFKLEQLTLLTPNLTWDVVQSFDDLFQVGELAISEYNIDRQSPNETDDPNGVLLKNALKTGAERIYMYKYRGVTNSGIMDRWAKATGISRGTSSFVLEKLALQWNSRSLDWNEWSAFKHYAMGLEKFWLHSGSV